LYVEHRDVHSLYGYFSSLRTFEALKFRSKDKDSSSDWENFHKCAPILLQKSLCGINFIGGDVPGFYGDPLLPSIKE